jgi:hypothetical protein
MIGDHYQGSAWCNILKRLRIEIRTDACEPYGIVPEGCRDARPGSVLVASALQLLLPRGNFDQSYEQTLAPAHIGVRHRIPLGVRHPKATAPRV